jgi:hypothetical protein
LDGLDKVDPAGTRVNREQASEKADLMLISMPLII